MASVLAEALASVLRVIQTHTDDPRLEAALRTLLEELDPTIRRLFVRASQLSMKAQALVGSTS